MKNRGTAVTVYWRTDGALVGFRAQGHSGYAQSGSDIVCAAISALTQTFANGLSNVLQVPVECVVHVRHLRTIIAVCRGWSNGNFG